MSILQNSSASVAALSIFMTGTAAFADISSQEVWDDWKSYMTGFGYTVEGDETISGGNVTVSNVTMGMSMPDGVDILPSGCPNSALRITGMAPFRSASRLSCPW